MKRGPTHDTSFTLLRCLRPACKPRPTYASPPHDRQSSSAGLRKSQCARPCRRRPVHRHTSERYFNQRPKWMSEMVHEIRNDSGSASQEGSTYSFLTVGRKLWLPVVLTILGLLELVVLVLLVVVRVLLDVCSSDALADPDASDCPFLSNHFQVRQIRCGSRRFAPSEIRPKALPPMRTLRGSGFIHIVGPERHVTLPDMELQRAID